MRKVLYLPAISVVSVMGRQMPCPWLRANSGLGSPGRTWQLSPWPQRAVYTPQDSPSWRAQVWQQPQPGWRAVSAQPAGTGGHRVSFSSVHGAQCIGWRATLETREGQRSKSSSSKQTSVESMVSKDCEESAKSGEEHQ